MKNLLLCVVFATTAYAANGQCAFVTNCPADTIPFCDHTTNDVELWNEPYWLDTVHNSHDLSDGPVDLSLAVRDSCGGAGLALRGVLYLDLDGDGAVETAIDSDSTYAPGVVPFGNLTGAATPRNFDGRPVPMNLKYRFTMRLDTTGDVVTAAMVWRNGNIHTLPALPPGAHRMEWMTTQNGATDTCAYTFTVADCKAPVVATINGLSTNILTSQLVTLWASDFLLYAEDNATPTNQLRIGIRRSGTGTGFPFDAFGNPVTSVTFTCVDLGTQFVELWAIDAAGNTAFAETYVLVQNNLGVCGGIPWSNLLDVCIVTEMNEGIEDVEVTLDGSTSGVPTVFGGWMLNGACYRYNGSALPLAANYVVVPSKTDNPLNGVSTFDLVLISRHILGQEPLSSPYKMIAADANKSNSISTFDIVELRKLILGVYSELPNNDSWRFVWKDYVFPNPLNPFAAQWPETVTVGTLQSTPVDHYFIGMKIGDVNNTALPESAAPGQTDDRATAATLLLPDAELWVSEKVDIPVYSADKFSMLGFQLALSVDPARLEVLGVTSDGLDDFSEANYAVRPDGTLRLSWNTPHGRVAPSGTPLFSLRVRARAAGSLRDAVGLATNDLAAEFYPADGGRRSLALDFAANPSEGGLVVLPPRPNPATTGAAFDLDLPGARTVVLELWSADGRRVYRSQTALPRGRQRLELPAGVFGGAGVYVWRVLAGDEAVSGKIVHE